LILGKTGLEIDKDGLGALPLQRANLPDSIRLIQAAVDGGINYIDTARAYSDSEQKLGLALDGRRDTVYIASKTMAQTAEDLNQDLETSLRMLKTDHIDVYQLHNPGFFPDETHELYVALQKAKKDGKIRFIGLTNHRVPIAVQAAKSGLYDVIQYPFSYLSTSDEIELTKTCQSENVGYVAMKALGGGLITDVALERRYLNSFSNVVPIWGLQHMWELEALLEARRKDGSKIASSQDFDKIEADRLGLGDSFCRGCGYCMPCPEGIQIFNCARTSLMIRRAPGDSWFSESWQAEMSKIENCQNCNTCASRCPYGLNTPELLRKNLEDYREVLKSQANL
jgi:aryl-alcohol dehydrogenase-like predicted oxidoreductase